MAKTNTRATIAREVSRKLKINSSDVLLVLNESIDCLIGHIKKAERIDIRGLGTWKFKRRKAVIRRNPRSPQDEYEIPAHTGIIFKPSHKLKLQVAGVLPPDFVPESVPAREPEAPQQQLVSREALETIVPGAV